MNNQDNLQLASISTHRGMTKKRKISDGIRNFMTYLSIAIAIFVLGSVFVYVFNRGWDSLSWDLIKGNYHKTNYMVNFEDGKAGSFTKPDNLSENEYFSEKFGFAVEDAVDSSKTSLILVSYIDENSPLNTAVNAIAGETKGQKQEIGRVNVDRISFRTTDDKVQSAGIKAKQNAQSMVGSLDANGSTLVSMNYQNQAGGIRGSLQATLMLIGLTLLFALPIGIFAAIYLNELAPDNKLTQFMRSCIEMLNAVPSIVFGLMGMVVFFPFTALFGATTPNILLGALTMVVVILPVIIRQTEEALIAVPNKLRMGSLALGATETQTVFKVVLPNALAGILTAVLLSVSRIIGESAALLFTMGTFVSDQPQITGRATSLAVQIWSVMSGEQPNFELASAISIIVLAITLVLNISVKIITSRLNKKWKE
ncbi:phosphate ABC transporter permease PstA [uncultured Helcococcus sp.]|uniref:phosphate ABC transporter permease PstA n=1 Tax=uncultured Helcococcus sp. TaxID=1072508 RepID=UPI0026320896|nr:phosphate ABC transporter permease PstA [uncultured Helcococcus sp.]